MPYSSADPKSPAPAAAERLRVLMVNSTLHIGGAEQVAANLTKHMDRRQFDVTACFLKENGIVGKQMLEAGVDLVPIPGFRGKRDYFTALKLRKLVKQRGIQLLHSHDIHGLMDAALCRLSVPGLRHVHTFHFGNYPHISPRYARIERLLWRVPDALIAVGHEQAATIRKLHNIPAERMQVIWNGTDAPTSDLAPEVLAQLPRDGTPVIGSISTLIPQKGLPDLLQAAALLRQQGKRFLMIVAGEGKLRRELEAQAHSLGLQDQVRFLGWVSAASRRALPACDIFVQSSHWEAMSVVVLEAMAGAKPMVITSVGENARVVINEQSGLVVPPRAPQALADGLARLLDDVDLRHRLGAAAQQRFGELFTVQQMVHNYEHLYAQLIHGVSTVAAAERAA
ncbi:glycosyltransferase family 4 protein [Steroidobacter sp.]|uniref:glycosyltransferase family 4 protein n=1 Tax=Steroidobacter sp. TaxID=1978227 RepID=UPI001A635204|nr:glycosyltransferase family 4 protein [Steroidobacter sp.]MBL8269750.1 glycosyltransferase family 4 protein [Steroidobacter sp.]